MKFELADVVTSLNGRDKGKCFIVVGKDDDYSLIADGKGRKLENPKRKKNKHLISNNENITRLSEKFEAGEKITNKELRKILAEYTTQKAVTTTKGDVQ